MEDITLNRKCKECKWFDGRWCTEPERNRINKEKGWDYYRNFRRMSYEPACKRFKEKENDMTQKEFDNAIETMDKNISDMVKLIDKMDKLIENLPDEIEEDEKPIEEKKKRLTNKYNIGDIVYVPFRIKGIDITYVKDPYNEGEVIMYKLSRPFNIDSVTQDALVEKGSHYWKCHATDRVTQATLEMAQRELK